MADSNPDAKAFRFPCAWNGVPVLGTAVARHDTIELFPVPGLCIEIPRAGFEELSTHLIVAAHTRREPAAND